MHKLIELLKRFNRKERFFLIGQALGNRDFTLSGSFRKCLGDEICIEIPPDAFVAMDYHLDSVAACIWKYRNPQHQMNANFPKRNGLVTGTQRDIDLLIAFNEKDRDIYHLVFVEAKGYESDYRDGYATWNTKEIREQVQNKACQLDKIYSEDRRKSPEVKFHFCLMSHARPKKPQVQALTKNWPKWMKKNNEEPCYWMELCLPSDRLRAARCNPDGELTADGDHFCIVKQ